MLYAAIIGRPIVWAVVEFSYGTPRLVPLGRWVFEFEGDDVPEWRPVPVSAGEVFTPQTAMGDVSADEVVYAPAISDLMLVIKPWIEVESDGQ